MELKELFQAFKLEAVDCAEKIDPNDDYYWDSLAFGFAIAKGATREQAYHLQWKWDDYATGLITIDNVVETFDPAVFDDETEDD